MFPESDKPLGSEPLAILHVIGTSPVAESDAEYELPTVPSGNDAVVMVGGVGFSDFMVMDNDFLSLPAAFVA